ncbi:PREDICTED: transferrin receptor protein 1 [Chaetura pelagica]|uniref:transferrin receptor protein 1 n=1 Tax=Chaetura pelagica TaxID=8897 RepID=UPI0005234E74|nr:PREDICTED: transferrin receptor protein 1 [Chaetura pelagica]
MDHARAVISTLCGGEPSSYTRFSVARQTDGDNSHLEMKLSADDEEGGETGRPDHLHARIPPSRRSGRNICFPIIAAVLLLLIGFLIGYLSYRGRMQKAGRCMDGSGKCEMTPTKSYLADDDEAEAEVIPGPPVLYWPELRNLLSKKLSATRLEDSLRRRANKDSFEAGLSEDENVASYIHDQFTSFLLDEVWNDEHYIKLQVKGSSNNEVSILGVDEEEEILERPSAYVAYSKTDSVAGKPVYVNYGEKADFQKLQMQGISLNGTITIFRAGKITLAEKVANAQEAEAVGALMYLDPYKDTDTLVPFGHAHLGTGDPYTPGFPSFNHTQFPPVESSGLPRIVVQTISGAAVGRLFSKMGDGEPCISEWRGGVMACKVMPSSTSKMTVKLNVSNVMVDRKILNIFGAIKGFEEPDRYVVIGAQRDSWGPGAAKAGVGTAILLELARVISDMVKNDGFKPRRSIIFASWSAGEYGAVGATEWLEGYSATLHSKAFTYINLDAAVLGSSHVKISASPLLYTLLERTMKGVKDPTKNSETLYDKAGSDWVQKIVPLGLDNAAFPFLAYSGIPVVSFGFYNKDEEYPFLGTTQDTVGNLRRINNLYDLMRAAAEVAGQIALRLTHDHELYLDFERYSEELLAFQDKFLPYDKDAKGLGLTLNWLFFARGDFQRATDALRNDIANSDRENRIVRRALNDRIMKVEYDFLSPFLSPKDAPFRHIFFGKGSHTLQSLLENLQLLRNNKDSVDVKMLKEQLALVTWTIKGAANALVGDIWDTDNEF